jgi:outer membrane protein assembly factor BamD
MYPRSEKAEEAAFLSAYCNYMNSPRPSLDQSSTYIALSELQMFIDMYPNSSKLDEAHRLMDDLRQKLETKSYNVSKLYYKMQDYQAAITSFENLLDDYPDTQYKEEVLYYITMAYFEYAEKSIFSKRTERYEKTVEAYNNLLYLYPDSKYLKSVENINEDARERLNN